MAQFIELEMDQGADFALDLDISNVDGTAQNVTNYSFSSSIKKSYYSSNVSANLVVSIFDASNGNVTLSLDAANTANIKAGRYLFDVKQIDSSNGVTRLFEGIVTVNPQVTK